MREKISRLRIQEKGTQIAGGTRASGEVSQTGGFPLDNYKMQNPLLKNIEMRRALDVALRTFISGGRRLKCMGETTAANANGSVCRQE